MKRAAKNVTVWEILEDSVARVARKLVRARAAKSVPQDQRMMSLPGCHLAMGMVQWFAQDLRSAVTGPATADGTIALYFGGVRVTVGVTSGQAATAIATNITAAITAAADLPVTAATVSASSNLTFRHKGAVGNSYEGAEFLSVHEYRHVIRWAEEIFARPAVKRGRMVNRAFGPLENQLRERHDASDFELRTQDKLEPAEAS